MTPFLERLVVAPLVVFVGLLAGLLAHGLMTGRIRAKGLLTDPHTGATSAVRVQMLIGTIVAVATYGASIRNSQGTALPPVDEKLLALVGGSNGLALGMQLVRKVARFIRPAR